MFWMSLRQKLFVAEEPVPQAVNESLSEGFARLTRSEHAKDVEDRRRKDDITRTLTLN